MREKGRFSVKGSLRAFCAVDVLQGGGVYDVVLPQEADAGEGSWAVCVCVCVFVYASRRRHCPSSVDFLPLAPIIVLFLVRVFVCVCRYL